MWNFLPNRFSIRNADRFLLIAEHAFIVFSILVFSRALIFNLFEASTTDFATGLNDTAGAPSGISQPKIFWLYLFIYIGTGLLILPRIRLVIRALFGEKYILLLILLAALSILWSTDPRDTLVKVIALGACTSFGVYLTIRYDVQQQMHLFAITFFLIIITSIFVAVYAPDIGIMHGIHEGIWRGVFLHKNALGTYMLLAGIVFFLLTIVVTKYRFFYFLAFCLAVLLLILSCAKSSLLSWVILFSVLGVYFARFNRPKVAVVAMVSVVFVLCAFVMQYKYKVMPPILAGQIATSIAKSNYSPPTAWAQLVSDFEAAQRMAPPGAFLATGDGRLRLWGHLWEKIKERPWLGYGVGGFWRGMHGPSADIWKLETWLPPGAHNGFIDLWLDLGVMGVGLLVLSIAFAMTGSIASIANGPSHSDLLFPVAILIGLCFVKVAEGELFGANVLTWVLFVTAVMNVQNHVGQSGEELVSPALPDRIRTP
jgi:exopolysaccharide production protein ExoQ